MSGYMPPRRHVIPKTDPAKPASDIRSRSHYEAMAWVAQCHPTISPTALRRAHPNPDVAEVIVYNNGGRLPPPPPTRPTPRDLPNPPRSPNFSRIPSGCHVVIWATCALAVGLATIALVGPEPPHQSQPEPPTARPLEPCR